MPRSYSHGGKDNTTLRLLVGMAIAFILCFLIYNYLIIPNIPDTLSFWSGFGFALLCVVLYIVIVVISIRMHVSLS